MANHDARAIANEFIDMARERGRDLTHMALQKLVYIAHGWNFALNPANEGENIGSPLIKGRIEAWDWGPVIPSIWDSLKRYGNKPISDYIHEHEWKGPDRDRGNVLRENLSHDEREILEMVFEVYGGMSGGKLSEITHENDTPWSDSYRPNTKNIEIPNDLIAHHYKKLKEEIAA